MSISLKSIELSNIRSHEHFKFVPAESGVTAISGPTGSGKSTVVDSLAWILFGTKPKGVAKNSSIFREGADIKTDKCYARAELEVDGALIKVERKLVTKGGSANCDVWEWSTEEEDWIHKAGPAVSHAEPHIRQRLKMDEKGFLTAVLVQQKQVDQLISSGPGERAQVIEKLTGIASISSGIVAARKEHSGLKKASELSSVDESQLADVEKELKDSSDTLGAMKKSYRGFREEVQELQAEVQTMENSVDEETSKFERVESARKAAIEIEVKLESRESLLEEAKADKEEAKAQVSQRSVGISYEESLEALDGLRSTVSGLSSDQKYQVKLRDDSRRKSSKLSELIEASDFSKIEAVTSEREKIEAELRDLKAQILESRESSGGFGGEISQIQSAIEVVSKGDDCPTCRQSVDDVAAAVSSLEVLKSQLEAKRSEADQRLEELTESSKAKSNLKEKLQELEEFFEELESSLAIEANSVDRLSSIDAELKTKEAELKAAEKLHKSIEREEENSKRYSAALKRVQKIVESIEDLKGKRKKAKAILKEGGALSENKLNALRKKLYKLQTRYQDKRVDLNEMKSEARILSNSIDHLTEKRDIYSKEIERHKEILRSVEVSAATLQTLTEFKADRIKTALPTIETYASELLTRFTDGKFIALKLDEKFNASVTLSNGMERPVGLLSGGELSAASIALRLSVSMMLNSSDSHNLIILDEVLVSQDMDRSELILSTIRDVCKGQVIMIAHGEGVSAIADKKVEMEGD